MTLWDKLEKIKKNTGKEINIKLYYQDYVITDFTRVIDFIMNMSSFILELDESKYEIKSTCLSNYFIIRLKKEVFE